jgi:hypothetical protein
MNAGRTTCVKDGVGGKLVVSSSDGRLFQTTIVRTNRMWPPGPRTLAAAHLDESKQMIIRRIRVMDPREEHTEHQENRRRAERSTCNNSNPHGAEIRIVRDEEQTDEESGLKQLRRIYPRSPRL